VPAVAFDKDGNRLGRGKGFYDRLLNHTKAVKIGVAYDFQLVDEIPVEPHDIPVDRVITPMAEIIISEK
jgi:5-formyltetrahydrofolate cyclo-ligase